MSLRFAIAPLREIGPRIARVRRQRSGNGAHRGYVTAL